MVRQRTRMATLSLAAVLTIACSAAGVVDARPHSFKGIGAAYRGPHHHCEPIIVPMCKTMPWNWTSMPNLVHQSTQGNARLYMEQYEPLVATKCSSSLAFFLCAMYTPMCMDNMTEHVPPCRSVCEAARSGCEPVVLRYNRTWPDFLACDGLPEYESSMCLSPRAFNASIAPPPPTPVCKCKSEFKFQRRDYQRYNSTGYVMVATVLKQHLHESTGETATVVIPNRIFKNRQQLLSVDRNAHLWTPVTRAEPCNCVQLQEKKRYFIACREDRRNGRLLLEADCLLAPWNDKWPEHIEEHVVLDLLTGKIKNSHHGRAAYRLTTTTVSSSPTALAGSGSAHRIRSDRYGAQKKTARGRAQVVN